MKIMAIGYYDDFARFYLALKKEFQKKNDNVGFIYLSLYLSGFLYFVVRFQKVSFFSLKVWINKIIKQKKYQKILSKSLFYKGINLDEIIKYHKLLGKEDEKTLKLQAISYIDIIEKTLKKVLPDILILSGDSRMSIEIFNIQAKVLGIKIYYFEQGPFGTTIIDEQGVNANASIRNRGIEKNQTNYAEKEQNIKDFFSRRRSPKYKRNPIYRGSDYIFQFLFSKIGLLPVDIKMEKEKISIVKEYKNISVMKNNNKKIFLLILQVPYDVNMVYHSPLYNNHFDIVKDIFNNLPQNSHFLVREHPLYEGKYEKELYIFMNKKNISLDNKSLYESIDNSTVIIVNNSTVGIEAISRFKPVIVLGNSYYDNDSLCMKLKDKRNLKNLLNNSKNFNVDKNNILNFLDYFLNNYLIDGHYRDSDLDFIKTIYQMMRRNT